MKPVRLRYLILLESMLLLKASDSLEQPLAPEEYVSNKVIECNEEIKHLAKVAVSQPHAAYAAFT